MSDGDATPPPLSSSRAAGGVSELDADGLPRLWIFAEHLFQNRCQHLPVAAGQPLLDARLHALIGVLEAVQQQVVLGDEVALDSSQRRPADTLDYFDWSAVRTQAQ